MLTARWETPAAMRYLSSKSDSCRLLKRWLSLRRLPALFVLLGLAPGLRAQSVTSTALAVSSAGATVGTVKEGSEVTLTATVTLAGGSAAAPPGQVNFCEVKAAPLKCTDIRLLGTVQLGNAGTAIFNFYPGPGTHVYQAVFLGTHVEASSVSAQTPFVVTPFYPTGTTITVGGSPGNYTLTATVTGTQGTTAPTGTVSFIDTSNASYVLATAPLVPSAAPPGVSFDNAPNLVPPAGVPSETVTDLAEFTGDGKLDIFLARQSIVFLGNGDGTFSELSSLLPSSIFAPDVTADFNGDGKEDMAAVASTISGQNFVQILLGTGNGTFTAGQVLSFPGAQAVATGDFN
jgi:hypothetical protein